MIELNKRDGLILVLLGIAVFVFLVFRIESCTDNYHLQQCTEAKEYWHGMAKGCQNED